MAKRGNDQNSSEPTRRLRVRWVEVELDGADTTIAEALRTVERMRRPVIVSASPPKQIAPGPSPADEEAPTEEATLFSRVKPETGDADTSDLDQHNGVEAAPGRKKRGEGPPQDRNAGLSLVGEIDFVPRGQQSLKTLFATKAPKTDMEQILVICYFLQHIAKAEQVGPNHLYSGLKHLTLAVPKDLRQTIRNMKKGKAWLGFTDIENIRVTTEGDNHVEHVLGKTEDITAE